MPGGHWQARALAAAMAAVAALGPAAPAVARALPARPARVRPSAWTDPSARQDLIARLTGRVTGPDNGTFMTTVHDDRGGTMDTMKIVQDAPGSYLAVYTTANTVRLATSGDLVHWHFTRILDPGATQPYLAEAPGRSFVLADEKFDQAGAGSGDSHLHVLHYASAGSLLAGRPEAAFTPPVRPGLGSRFFSACNEGTPDISLLNANASVIGIGFHYSQCGHGPDRQAYGTLTGMRSMNAAEDRAADRALTAAGYPGKHGGRDLIAWHGFPFSIIEAQDSTSLSAYTNWRYVLYDLTDGRAYPLPLPRAVTAATGAYCHGNPRVTALSGPGGEPLLAVTGFLFGGAAGCATSGEGELVYTVPASGPP